MIAQQIGYYKSAAKARAEERIKNNTRGRDRRTHRAHASLLMCIRWTPAAAEDLQRIYDYLKQQEPFPP